MAALVVDCSDEDLRFSLKQTLMERDAQIQDAALDILSENTMEDLDEKDVKQKIKSKIQERLIDIIEFSDNGCIEVLFTSFAIQ